MATIRETIQQALPAGTAGQYSQHIDRVVGALVHREDGIKASIVQQAAQMGLPRDRAEEALNRAGLANSPMDATPLRSVTDPAGGRVQYDPQPSNGQSNSADVQQEILAVLQRIARVVDRG